MDVVVQPSVPWMSLNDEIKESGLFFPVDPGPSVSALHPSQQQLPGFRMRQLRTRTNERGRLGLEAWWEQAAGSSVTSS